MQAKPLLLIDIDGVISLFGFGQNNRPDGVWAQIDGIAHLLSTAAAEHLQRLQSVYDCVWCSGWEDKANEYLPHLLGLGPFPVIVLDRHTGPGTSVQGHWKLDAIDAYAGRQRPLAWIDDFLDAACERWASERPGPTLLVPTEPADGLTATGARLLTAWAPAAG